MCKIKSSTNQESCIFCSSSNLAYNSLDMIENILSFDVDCRDCFSTTNVAFTLHDVTLKTCGDNHSVSLTDEQRERYLLSPQSCPVCQFYKDDSTEIQFGTFNCDQKQGHMIGKCPSCDSSWLDSYELKDITIVDLGKLANA